MHILEQFQKQAAQQINISNEEYLSLQIWQLENTFKNEIGAIKDSNLDYVAISDGYLKAFELESEILTSEDNIMFNIVKICTDEIKKQEQAIINTKEYQDSIFLFQRNQSKSRDYYLLRKRPIVNPSTDEVAGIFIAVVKYDVALLRIQYIKHFLGWSKADMIIKEPLLNEQQQQVMLCLLYGVHSRKKIAEILSKLNKFEINEIRVKNILNKMYNKFNCRTSPQLVQLIMKSQIKLELPLNSMEEGNYPLHSDPSKE